MSPNHRRLRAGGSMILAIVAMTGLLTGAVGLAPGAVAAGLAPGAVAADPVVGATSVAALTKTTLTSVGGDGTATAAQNARAAIAENGRYVAFQSQAALKVSASVPVTSGPSPSPSPSSPTPSPSSPGPSLTASRAASSNWRVYVRDETGQTTTLLSNPGAGNATAPTISARGKLASYLLNDGIENNVDVVNRQATGQGAFDTPANLTVKRVTGTPNDLQFERIPGCPTGFGTTTATRTTPCGPKLSADGSTLVYPAQLSPVSPALSTDVNFDSSATRTPLSGNVIDFGLGAGVSGGGFAPRADIDITVQGNQPVTFSPPTVTGPFTIGPNGPDQSSCTGAVGPGATCTVTVNFNQNNACPQTANSMITGTLQTNANVPAGQSRITLVAYCNVQDEAYVRPSSPGAGPPPPGIVLLALRQPIQPVCPAAPTGLHLVKAPAVTSDDGQFAPQPLIDLGAGVIGQPYVAWTTFTVPLAGQFGAAPTTFVFAAKDCGLQLVSDPASLGLADKLPAGQPAPCLQNESLQNKPSAARASCTAYVLVTPGAVGTDVAALTDDVPGYGTAINYLAVTGVSNIVIARHDKTSAGNFVASASTVVSMDGKGNVIPDASQPSVSATGRYVAFTAPVPAGQAGAQVGGSISVWRHDTDAAGNRTYHYGATIVVSCLPGGKGGSCPAAANADSPSLSGDGSLVAFATVAPNGQVYTRDIAAGTSALVSVPASGTAGSTANGDSYAPALSQDGSTVAYVSTATDLTGTATPGGAANLFVRMLGAGSAAGNEVASQSGASLPAGDDIALPDIDAHGGLVTFQTSQQVLPAAPKGTESIYTFERLPRLVFSPARVSFGIVKAHSARRTSIVTVTNIGPGPGTVTGTGTSAPFGMSMDSCVGAMLHADSTCTFTASLTPQQEGQDTANLTVTTTSDGGTSVAFAAPVTATGLALLSLMPGVAPPGQVTQVTGTGFIPGQHITLSWNPGLGQAGVVADKSGDFTAAMVIFPDDFTGPRVLQAADASGKVLAAVNFLAQQQSVEPPFTATSPSGAGG